MIDLTQVLFEQRGQPRGDEHSAHIADLYNCDRATWYRRNGYSPEPFTPEKLAQFAIGHGYEMEVGATLIDAGYNVRTGVEVEYLDMIGHPDIVIGDELLIECKTTEAVNPKDSVSLHHAVQAAAYALALGIEDCAVLVKHARSHVEAVYAFKAEGYRELIEQRAAEVATRTKPGAPIPPAVPNPIAKWGCSYCSFRMCSSNPDFDKALEEIGF